MESLIIDGTTKTPDVNFNAERGLLEVKGRSIPENSIEFYKPLVDWLEEYAQKPFSKTQVNEAIHKNKYDVQINWYYEEDDEDMLEAGEDYESIIRVPFKMIEIVD